MVDYNIYNIKQLEFRLDMKINYVYIYKYIASEVPSIIYIYTYNIHIHNIYFFFFFPSCSFIFPLSGYLGSCSEPLLRRGKHIGILELFSRFENTNIK